MAFNEIGRMHMIHLAQATGILKHRGPDHQHNFIAERTGLGHRRLSVIDLSPNAHQPMADATGRYHIVYNGEIYNFRDLRQQLQNSGVEFKSNSDTEVLLNLYIHQGEDCLQKLNGCFAFAVYDTVKNQLFLARDRLGINPLLYYHDRDKFLFASEMRSLLAYNIPRNLDFESLNLYLELNYVPAPYSMIEGVMKLLPGEYLVVDSGEIFTKSYYEIPKSLQSSGSELSYDQQQQELYRLMEESVSKRLVSDVPLGTFLSGGIDSSVVTAIASRHLENLNTFSIGYRDQPFFDETSYAQLVADKFGTYHTVFKLDTQGLFEHLHDLWDHLDEPFADSSALPAYILSKFTRQSVTVALSGDGADELFGGYNKHLALLRSLNGGIGNSLIRQLSFFTGFLPQSRNGYVTNKIRQFNRMAHGLKLSATDRYWYWAGIATKLQAAQLLNNETIGKIDELATDGRRKQYLRHLGPTPDLNDILFTDMKLVLPNDMLTKVDGTSMAHGLEVRVPFLDHEVVNFVSRLPVGSKIKNGMRKRLLQDTFKDLLPKELYNRPKKGFEVPLLNWMRNELSRNIQNDLSEEKLQDQGIFDPSGVKKLKRKLQSSNPGDSPARIWGLLVFQKWWQQYLSHG